MSEILGRLAPGVLDWDLGGKFAISPVTALATLAPRTWPIFINNRAEQSCLHFCWLHTQPSHLPGGPPSSRGYCRTRRRQSRVWDRGICLLVLQISREIAAAQVFVDMRADKFHLCSVVVARYANCHALAYWAHPHSGHYQEIAIETSFLPAAATVGIPTRCSLSGQAGLPAAAPPAAWCMDDWGAG